MSLSILSASKPAEDNDENSLESPDKGSSTGLGSPAPVDDANKKPEAKKKLGSGFVRGIISRLNIYLLLFI